MHTTPVRQTFAMAAAFVALVTLTGCVSQQASGFPKVTSGMTYSKVADLMGTPQKHVPRRQLDAQTSKLAAKNPPKQEWCLAPLYFANGGYVLPECYVYSEPEMNGGIRTYVIVFTERGNVATTYITRTPRGAGNPETWFPADTDAP